MLNYIWAGLIIISVIFAFGQDGMDFIHDEYRNGESLPVEIAGVPPGYGGADDAFGSVDVSVKIDPATYIEFFDPLAKLGVQADSDEAEAMRRQVTAYFQEPIDAKLITTDSGRELHIAFDGTAPYPLDVIYNDKKDRNDRLPSKIMSFTAGKNGNAAATADVKFAHVGFITTKKVSAKMFTIADDAVMFAIGLMGVIALWMGLMKIAEDSGLVNLFVKLVRPVLHPLFPQVPKDHPALGLIAVNLAANMLALGNAATPLGIKAMESLQELNKEKDTATDSMVMLLAMNTASVQLLPPVTLIAIMGLASTEIFLPIFFVTAISLVVAIVSAKLLGRMKVFRKTDPMRPNNPNAEQGGCRMSDELRAMQEYFASVIIPLIVIAIPIYGMCRRVKVYESFVEGAKEGFKVGVMIIPYLVAIFVAINMFRASGAMEAMEEILREPLSMVGIPPEVLPMAIIRPLTGGGSAGVVADLTQQYGSDSIITRMAGTMFGSTETTFYIIAVYFGAVNVKKTRHAVPAGLIADFVAILLSIYIVRLWFG